MHRLAYHHFTSIRPNDRPTDRPNRSVGRPVFYCTVPSILLYRYLPFYRILPVPVEYCSCSKMVVG
eukprot:COSAG05_NODE_840_length_7027_cov_416.630052_2_plen_66_part_00